MERNEAIRNKLQASKTILEALINGQQPPKSLIEIALRDLDEVENIISNMAISKEKAWGIGKAYFEKRGIQPLAFEVKDLRDVSFSGYNVPRDAWVIFYPNPKSLGMGIHSSYAILISKETGEIIFDGDANDEG